MHLWFLEIQMDQHGKKAGTLLLDTVFACVVVIWEDFGFARPATLNCVAKVISKEGEILSRQTTAINSGFNIGKNFFP